MTTRTDAHSPTNLTTEDYSYLYAADLDSPWALRLNETEDGQAFLRVLSNLDPATADRGYGQCHHCGAWIRYAAWLRHDPTGYTIVVGETCLDNRFGRATADFQQLRKAAQLDRLAQRLLAAYNEFLSGLDPVGRALLCSDAEFETIDADEYVTAARTNSFVSDVRRRVRQYGNGSRERAAKDAAEAEEITIPVPEGRYQITGEVLSTKWVDSDYGSTLKMLVKVDTLNGVYRIFGSVPSALTVERGDNVTFTATVERSAKDESFGFFKRPTKATLLETV
jgi:hypothetical protein